MKWSFLAVEVAFLVECVVIRGGAKHTIVNYFSHLHNVPFAVEVFYIMVSNLSFLHKLMC